MERNTVNEATGNHSLRKMSSMIAFDPCDTYFHLYLEQSALNYRLCGFKG